MAKEKRKFQYKPRGEESYKKRQNQSAGSFDSAYKSAFTTWAPKAGDHRLRVLPPTWDDPAHYGIDVWLHSNVGPDNQTYLCLDKMKGDPCPICEAHTEAKRQGDDKLADEIRPYKRVLVWCIIRGEEKQGPVLWPMPWTLDRDWTTQAVDSATGEVFNVDDPEEGYDLIFAKEGQGIKTKYVGASIARRSSALSMDDEDAQEWLDFVSQNPLPSVLNFFDADYIAGVFSGKKAKKKVEDDDDEEEEKPKTRSSKSKLADDEDERPKARTKKVADIDEDDDEEEEKPKPKASRRVVDDDDDEEEEKPKPRTKKVVDDDDDEEEKPKPKVSKRVVDEDDDEEEEKPKPKVSKRVVDEDDDEEEEKPKPRTKKVVDDDDEKGKPPARGTSSSREGRRRRDDDDEEEEEAPRREPKFTRKK